jgi:hypothetical protein
MSEQPETPTPEQAQVKEDIRDRAEQVRSSTPPPRDDQNEQLGAQAAVAGAGATDVDVPQLLAYIKQLSERMETLEAEKRDQNAPPLLGTIESLGNLLRAHAASAPRDAGNTPLIDHKPVLALADDLADAGKNAVESGDLTHVKAIGAKIAKWLERNHPGPGENAHYRQAVDFAGPHLEDAAENFEAQPKRTPAPAVGSSRPPAKVVPGSVTG